MAHASQDGDLEHLSLSHPRASPTESDTIGGHAVRNSSKSITRSQSRLRRLRACWTWLFTDTWILEYAALTLAIAALVSVGIVLFVHRQRAKSDWKYSISLNTVLSLLATLLKGALMLPVGSCLGQLKWVWYSQGKRTLQNFQVFDSASRGPFGATWLLYTLRFWHIASIGCVVTLLALASDASVQQSVSYPSRKANASGVTTVPFSQWYDEYGENAGSFIQPEQSMRAAFYDGAFIANVSQTSASISAQCPTGNCTFPTYASLGVCSQCQNVSSLMKVKCVNYYEDSETPVGLNSKGCINQTILPNGLFLRNDDQTFDYITVYTSQNSAIKVLNTNELDPYQPSLINISVIVINTNGNNPNYSLVQYPNSFRAYDCVLSLCAKIYSSRVSQGLFTEEVVSEYFQFNSSSVIIPHGPLPHGSNLTFGTSSYALQSIVHLLYNQLNGTGGMTGFYTNQIWSTDVVYAMFVNGATKVNQTMANIATAMTNNMRQKSGTVVVGQAFTLETYIHVRWPWLLFPLIMVILATIFVALTVQQSHKWDVPSWRSSALAAMVHGVQTSEADGLDDGTYKKEKYGDLEKWAEQVDVRLRRTGNRDVAYGLVRAGG